MAVSPNFSLNCVKGQFILKNFYIYSECTWCYWINRFTSLSWASTLQWKYLVHNHLLHFAFSNSNLNRILPWRKCTNNMAFINWLRREYLYLPLFFSFGLMYHFPNGGIYVSVLMEITHQRSKWLGPYSEYLENRIFTIWYFLMMLLKFWKEEKNN